VRWDVHNHCAPREGLEALGDERLPVSAEGEEIAADRVRFRLGPEFTQPEAKLAELERNGLEAAVLSLAPPLLCHEAPSEAAVPYCEAVNRGLAAHCEAAPERLRWLAHLPLPDGEAAADALRAAVAAGAVGAQVGTAIATTPLDDPDLDPFWAAAADLGVPVMLHPAYNADHPRLAEFYFQNVIGNQLETTIAAERLICAGHLERHPNLRLLLVHAGGYLPWQIGRLRHARGVRSELADAPSEPLDALAQLTVDTITHDPTVLPMLVERMGAERVAMGTDLPFDMAPPGPVDELSEAVGEETAKVLMEDTPGRLFGLGS
jgi:aminocarboxymuconate-semialdehyde decarboxylase